MREIEFGLLGKGAVVLDPSLSIFLNPYAIRLDDHCRVDGLVKIEGGQGVRIGKYVHISSFCHINSGGGLVSFGDHSGCASHAVIIGGMPDLRYKHASAAEPHEYCHPLRRETVIGPYAIIFTHATVLPGRVVGEGAIIAAGAVVKDNVRPWEIWAGNPAVKIGERMISKHEALPTFMYERFR